MTHKLAELFGIDESLPDEDITQKPPLPSTRESLSLIEKIDSALGEVSGLDKGDTELDELADLAVLAFKDLQDLGMQTESRFSAEIFNVASSLLGHAITAKTAKINKKLKMISLQLQKATLDLKVNEKSEKIEATPAGEFRSLDRNELLKMFADKPSTE